METRGLIHLIDHDTAARGAIEGQLQLHGFMVKTYASMKELEQAGVLTSCGCLLLESDEPAAALARLQETATTLGVVVISGHVDVEAAVRAMRLGAIDVLGKPFSEPALLEAIGRALQASTAAWSHRVSGRASQDRIDRLTPREREVGQLVARGLTNKDIAAHLGMSINTVKVHRSRVMKKLDVTSLADLVRLVDRME